MAADPPHHPIDLMEGLGPLVAEAVRPMAPARDAEELEFERVAIFQRIMSHLKDQAPEAFPATHSFKLVATRVAGPQPSGKGEGKAQTTLMYDAIVDRMLTRTGAMETQKALLAAVQARFPGVKVPKSLTVSMQKWVPGKIRVRLRGGCEVPINPARIVEGMTLAELHREARLAVATLSRPDAVLEFKATILLTTTDYARVHQRRGVQADPQQEQHQR